MPARGRRISPSRLLEFLELVGQELPRKVVLVAAGGTAMTLLKVKPSTRDVDFTGPGEDIEVFRRTLDTLPHGMKVDTWPEGQVFSQFLPACARSGSASAGARSASMRRTSPVPFPFEIAGIAQAGFGHVPPVARCLWSSRGRRT